VTVIVVSFFESVFADHSKDHPVAVTHVGSDTLTEIRTPLSWTSPHDVRASFFVGAHTGNQMD